MTHTNWVTQYPFGTFSIPSYSQYTHRSVIFGTFVGLMSNCTENIDAFSLLTIDSLTAINNLLLVVEIIIWLMDSKKCCQLQKYTHRSVIFGTVVGLMSNCTENIDAFSLTIDSLTAINNLLLVLEIIIW